MGAIILLSLAENTIQLVPDGTLFLHIALILLMVYMLNATLFKPINRILEERERRTHGRLREAHETLQSVEQKLSHYERSLREARAEGYRLLEQERAAAMLERQNKLNVIHEELGRLIEEQKEMIGAQTAEARSALGQEARRIAAEISSQVLSRPVGGGPSTNVRV